jgi:hypothetical protein
MMTGKKNEIQSLQPKSKIISRIQEPVIFENNPEFYHLF